MKTLERLPSLLQQGWMAADMAHTAPARRDRFGATRRFRGRPLFIEGSPRFNERRHGSIESVGVEWGRLRGADAEPRENHISSVREVAEETRINLNVGDRRPRWKSASREQRTPRDAGVPISSSRHQAELAQRGALPRHLLSLAASAGAATCSRFPARRSLRLGCLPPLNASEVFERD
ncbi:hypothetical protein MRX96_010504 [Rhipicephalus microplus]